GWIEDEIDALIDAKLEDWYEHED
ncbi:hypothetical protein CCACVL1_27247, partial [Corchorus capsularis]